MHLTVSIVGALLLLQCYSTGATTRFPIRPQSASDDLNAGEILVPGFRPPAIPLINFDPYMNIWMMADSLTDDWPKLWDGTIKAFVAMVRVDGAVYRLMGPSSVTANAATQTSVKVFPTRTVCEFTAGPVKVVLTFTTPTLTDDFDVLSLPVTYITFDVQSADSRAHAVQLYYDNTGEIAVNDVSEFIVWSHNETQTLNIMQMGTQAQNILGNSGDSVGINWGYAYVAATKGQGLSNVVTGSVAARSQFAQTGTIPTQYDTRMPRAASDDWPVMAVSWDLGTITASSRNSRQIIFAYDDIYSINYFNTKMRPYWRKTYSDAVSMITRAATDSSLLISKCITFDNTLLQAVNKKGGANYATIASLSFRQTFAGCKLTWNEKTQTPWYFLKEISSDGDLSTVDVIFPASPLILYQSPQLLEYMMLPLLAYANNETYIPYNLTWSPHHLGIYPIGNLYPWQQEQMPMEETGNLLILIASIMQRQGHISTIYPHYWPLLTSWANYLVTVLPDPGDQLCTDDFEGPSPHNVNLAAKGIVALGAFGALCEKLGKLKEAQYYYEAAHNFSKYWVVNANDGNHYRLQYNLPSTWSLKYNIFYQAVVGQQTFPQSIIDTELAYYTNSQMNTYGVPLDNRSTFTKLDWSAWVAAMDSSTTQDIFHNIIDHIFKFANETTTRVPLTDWYWTTSGEQRGFQARPVVGGVYAKMLL